MQEWHNEVCISAVTAGSLCTDARARFRPTIGTPGSNPTEDMGVFRCSSV